MRRGALCLVFVLAACPGGGGGVGDTCSSTGDCDSSLQCLASTCVPRCARAPECGDGYACTAAGLCVAATGQEGAACSSATDCAAGLSCRFDPDLGSNGQLLATCTADTAGAPPNAPCSADADCREGTCALGRCIELCSVTRDCTDGTACTQIPRVGSGAATGPQPPVFSGCLQSTGSIAWSIPVDSPSEVIWLPVPGLARSVELTMAIDDTAEEVGALTVTSPSQVQIFDLTAADPFTSPVRHGALPGQSVLAMPSSPSTPLETGAYTVAVSSLRPPFGPDPEHPPMPNPGSSTPRATAVIKLDTGSVLDLHFYFLDLSDHPCQGLFGDITLTAGVAQTQSFFQTDYIGGLRNVFAQAGISIGDVTYEDINDAQKNAHHDLDGLDVGDAPSLLALGAHPTGINVFFVRSLSPVGLQAFGPNPGPWSLGGTSQSGVIVALDTVCYRSWGLLARLTAHELARYMGLYNNVELGHPDEQDPIADSDTSDNNLMFYSEDNDSGIELSPGQRDILQRSAVLH